ncbi:MAG: Kdo hydroxylase family protein [Acidobacteria bacterium]|nr:Kdo hydroxylase family protein [Acidobacteriota bacterium]
MSLINIDNFNASDERRNSVDIDRGREYCRQLEQGKIFYFDHIPFNFPKEYLTFLLSRRQQNTRFHKNISFRPQTNLLRGFPASEKKDFARLQEIMQFYSGQVTKFLAAFLPPYAEKRLLDYASFRTIEENGRDLPLHKRNELLHVDAFPNRPTRGGRILRVFTNINPTKERVWQIGESFERLAEKYASDAGLNRIAVQSASTSGKIVRHTSRFLKKIGLPVADRSAYDHFMLRFHDYLKENTNYQKNGDKTRLEFPPNSTWLVFTDGVPHSVLSGQFALEQTFIIPFEALVSPEDSPARVLEKMCRKSLIAV